MMMRTVDTTVRFFLSIIMRYLSATLFPYTTLFRSRDLFPETTDGSAMPGATVPVIEAPAASAPTDHVLAPALRRRLHHAAMIRSEEHTSELHSPCNLVCRLLLEKKK